VIGRPSVAASSAADRRHLWTSQPDGDATAGWQLWWLELESSLLLAAGEVATSNVQGGDAEQHWPGRRSVSHYDASYDRIILDSEVVDHSLVRRSTDVRLRIRIDNFG